MYLVQPPEQGLSDTETHSAYMYSILLATAPSKEAALQLSRSLVDRRLAACVNVLPAVSVYRWRGSVEEAGEALAILKTTKDRTGALEDSVRALHPYEEPEFIVLPVLGGSDSYMEWVSSSVAENPED